MFLLGSDNLILNIIKDLIPNLAIFVSTSFLIYLVMRNRRNFQGFYDINPNQVPLLEKFSLGMTDGIIGTFVMLYGLSVGENVIADLRHFSIMISALFGGIPAALVTGIIIAGSRFLLFEGPFYPTFLAAINAINMAIVSGFIASYVQSRKKWIYMNLYCLASISVVAILLLHGEWLAIMVPMTVISLISGICIFYLHSYLTKTFYLQDKIRENNDRFRAITENISDIVTILDEEGRTLYVSPSIEAYGIQTTEYEGLFARDFIHPDDRSRIRELFQRCLERKEMFKADFRWRKPDNTWVHVEVSATPIIENGTVTSLVVVCRDITERKQLEQTLLYLSNNDGLTKVANRRFFDQRLKLEWTVSKKNNSPLSLVMFDIDHFKLYNDTYGHPAGDTCLQNIAAFIKELIKQPHVVARYGGEEFAVILCDTNEDQAIAIAEKLRIVIESLKIPHESSKTSNVVTISVGVATQGQSQYNSELELIEKADQALYQAKKHGRNRVESSSAVTLLDN